MTTPVFVVGTGRCGSTMLSDMLKKHPAILNLSELFGALTDLATLIPQAFPDGIIDASHFWDILTYPHPKSNLAVRYGLSSADPILTRIIIQPRFKAGLPPIMTVLRRITGNDLEVVFDEMQSFVTAQSPAPIQHHYLRLFTWLQERFERKKWVERSVSLRFIPYLRKTFPDARFIHIVRDGRNTAISMSRHPGFRMLQLTSQLVEKLGVDPFESQDRSRIELLSDELRCLLPENFNASVFRNYSPPLAHYGRYWSEEIVSGLHVLAETPSQQVLTIHYEDILKEPSIAITQLITFIDPVFVDEQWLDSVVPMVKSARSSWQALPAEEQEQLQAACDPGFAALEDFQVSRI